MVPATKLTSFQVRDSSSCLRKPAISSVLNTTSWKGLHALKNASNSFSL
jgi:hypothetical protein